MLSHPSASTPSFPLATAEAPRSSMGTPSTRRKQETLRARTGQRLSRKKSAWQRAVAIGIHVAVEAAITNDVVQLWKVKGSPAAQILSLFEAVSHELASAHGGVRCRIAIRSTSGHLPPLRPGSSQPTAPPVLAAVAATAADDDDIDLLTAWTMITMMARKPRGGKACRLKYHAVKQFHITVEQSAFVSKIRS